MMKIRTKPHVYRRHYRARPWIEIPAPPLVLVLLFTAYVITQLGLVERHETIAAVRPMEEVRLSMPLCRPGNRHTCVIDGDTIRIKGETLRIANINAPESRHAQCAIEANKARAASRRLSEILTASPWQFERRGPDGFGRTLATLSTSEGDVGLLLVREGHAQIWQGTRAQWC